MSGTPGPVWARGVMRSLASHTCGVGDALRACSPSARSTPWPRNPLLPLSEVWRGPLARRKIKAYKSSALPVIRCKIWTSQSSPFLALGEPCPLPLNPSWPVFICVSSQARSQHAYSGPESCGYLPTGGSEASRLWDFYFRPMTFSVASHSTGAATRPSVWPCLTMRGNEAISRTSALHQPAFSLPKLTLTARLQSQALRSAHEKASQENEPPALQGNHRQSARQAITRAPRQPGGSPAQSTERRSLQSSCCVSVQAEAGAPAQAPLLSG